MTDSSFACAPLAFCDWRPGLIVRDFAYPANAALAVVAVFHDAAPPIVVYLPYYLLNFSSHLYTVPIIPNFARAVTSIRETRHARERFFAALRMTASLAVILSAAKNLSSLTRNHHKILLDKSRARRVQSTGR